MTNSAGWFPWGWNGSDILRVRRRSTRRVGVLIASDDKERLAILLFDRRWLGDCYRRRLISTFLARIVAFYDRWRLLRRFRCFYWLWRCCCCCSRCLCCCLWCSLCGSSGWRWWRTWAALLSRLMTVIVCFKY